MKEMVKRALRTFVQAAVGYIAAHITVGAAGVANGSESVKGALVLIITASVACGLAAVMNLPAEKREEIPSGEKTDGTDTAADNAQNDGGNGVSGNG